MVATGGNAFTDHKLSLMRVRPPPLNVVLPRAHTNRHIAAFDSLQEDFRNIINGRQNMVDPMSGKVYNVETGYNAYWAGDGYIYGTQNYDRSPKIGLHKLNDL